MKKTITFLLVFVMLFTFALGGTATFADENSNEQISKEEYNLNKISSEEGILLEDSDAKDESSINYAEITTIDVPVLESAVSTSKGITIKWAASEGAVKYKVYRKTGSEKWSLLSKVKDTSFTDETAKSGKVYYYTVRAIGKDGLKSKIDSNGISGMFIKAVTISKCAPKENGIKISWNEVKKADGYKIYRKTLNGQWTLLGETTDKLSFYDKKAKEGKTYVYVVRALKVKGGKTYKGYWSTKNTFTISRLAVPVSKTSSYKNQGVKIKWQEIKRAKKYYIYRKNENGKWQKIGSSKTNYFVDAKYAELGVENTYTVKAVDAYGNKSVYDSVGVTGSYVPMTKVTSIGNSASGIGITWNRVKGATGYVIYYRKADGKWEKVTEIKGSKNTSFYHYITFKAKKTYQYMVRPYKKINKTKYISGYKQKWTQSIKWVNQMIVSPLADGTSLCTWEYNDRNGTTVTRITPHQMVAHWTGKQCADYFVNNGIENSANYCIGYDGSIWCNVTENHRAWTSSSGWNDYQAITVELSNTEDIYSGKMTDETIEAFINLCVDLIQRYPSLGGKFNYTADSSCSTGNISLHRWFANTSCPGDWFVKKLPYIQREVNKRLKALNS